MLPWMFALMIISLLSYLADMGFLSFLREPVPYIRGSTISVIMMICWIGMMARVAKLARRGRREKLKERVDHLEGELKKIGEVSRGREAESIFRSWRTWRSKPPKKDEPRS